MASLNKILAIYHYPCPDGELSASIFKHYYPDTIFIPWMHELKREKIKLIVDEIESINEKLDIYFLDYCPDFNFVETLHKKVNKIYILDHHQSACQTFLENMKTSEINNIKIIYDNNKSGCQLTWDFFNKDQEYPISVKHIGNRDIWKWDDPNTEPFTAGYQIYFNINSDLSTEERISLYSKILDVKNTTAQEIIKLGSEEIDKMKLECETLLPLIKFSEDIDIKGTSLSLIEVPMTKYHLTKYMIELVQKEYPDYEVLKLCYQKENMEIFSLRSLKNNIRVDLLAQKYGGNGHNKASGYSIKLDN